MVKDIHGPALTLVLEKLKPYGAFQGTFFGSFFFANVGEFVWISSLNSSFFWSLESFESGRAVSVGATSKAKAGKSTANGVSKHGNRAVSSVCWFFFDYVLLDLFWFLTICFIISKESCGNKGHQVWINICSRYSGPVSGLVKYQGFK